MAIKLTAPAGKWRNGEIVYRAWFEKKPDHWLYVAVDEKWHIVTVIRMSFYLPGCHETESGALWSLRGIVASYFHDVRSHRGH